MQFVGKQEKVKQYGIMLMGLGLIFFGMELMSNATRPLRTYQPFIDLMQQMDNPVLGILIGALFTGIVQSSSATTGVIIVLATQGFITLEAGIALAFGANIRHLRYGYAGRHRQNRGRRFQAAFVPRVF